MLLPAAKAVVSAVVFTIAACCGRNTLQTTNFINSKCDDCSISNLLPESDYDNPKAMVQHLQSLKREDLLEIFRVSQAPKDLSQIEGEWNGYLLENNGVVMTAVSKVMTNGLFGKTRRWNGKAFSAGGRGINRFLNKGNGSSDKEHSFDYTIEESKIHSGKPSVKLQYANYQSRFSLWKTMVDEVRVVPGNSNVLIGFGAMAWSGGMKNSAPFCLTQAHLSESRFRQ